MFSGKIDASVNNILPTFSTGAGSLIISGSHAGMKIKIENTTTSRIVAWIGRLESGAPASGSNEVYILPKGGITLDEQHIGRNSKVFIRTDDGTTAITGVVTATIWGL